LEGHLGWMPMPVGMTSCAGVIREGGSHHNRGSALRWRGLRGSLLNEISFLLPPCRPPFSQDRQRSPPSHHHGKLNLPPTPCVRYPKDCESPTRRPEYRRGGGCGSSPPWRRRDRNRP